MGVPVYNSKKAKKVKGSKVYGKESSGPKYDPSKGVQVDHLPFDDDDPATNLVGKGVVKASQALDVVGSVTRSGIGGMLDAEEGEGPAGLVTGIRDQVKNIYNEGLEGTYQAPSGTDLIDKSGVEMDEGWMKSLAGAGVEMVADPFVLGNVGGKILKPLAKPIRKILTTPLKNQTAKALAPSISKAMLDSGVNPEKIANMMVEQELIGMMRSPRDLKNFLNGKLSTKVNPTSAGNIEVSVRSKGRISEISDDLAKAIKDSSKRIAPIKKEGLVNRVIDKNITADIGDITKVSHPNAGQYMEEVNRILKGHSYSTDELFQLKKSIGKELNSKEFWKSPDASMSSRKEAMLDVQREIDDVLVERLGDDIINVNGVDMNASDYYKVQNQKMHQMINLSRIVEYADVNHLKGNDFAATVMGMIGSGATAGVLGGVSGIAGAGTFGVAAGMAIPAIRQANRAGKAGAPANLVKAMSMAIDLPEKGGRFVPQMGREYTDSYAESARRTKRDNASMPNLELDQQEAAFNPEQRKPPVRMTNLPKALIDVKLPRDMESIMDNKEIFLAKVAQMRPDELEDWKMKLERPQEIRRMLPSIINMFPQLFEFDEYQRINHTVPQAMRPLATRDIELDDKLSTTDKIKKIDLLNRTGELYDDLEEYK